MNKTDLQALYLSGTYCHRTGTRPPSCAKPRQLTIYSTTHQLFLKQKHFKSVLDVDLAICSWIRAVAVCFSNSRNFLDSVSNSISWQTFRSLVLASPIWKNQNKVGIWIRDIRITERTFVSLVSKWSSMQMSNPFDIVMRPFCLVESCSQDTNTNVGVLSVYPTTILYHHHQLFIDIERENIHCVPLLELPATNNMGWSM